MDNQVFSFMMALVFIVLIPGVAVITTIAVLKNLVEEENEID